MSGRVPAWLDTPPDEAKLAPPVDTREQALPFGDLTWKNFERLVLRLVRRRDTVIDCALYGTPGQAQEGLDILAASTDDSAKVCCYQCKRVREFSTGDIRKATTKFLEGKWAKKTSKFVLCVSIPLESTQQQDEIVAQRKILDKRGIAFSIWDGSPGGELTEQLKLLPELVDDFFGRHWVGRFNGAPTAARLAERLDGNELGKLRQRLHGLYTTVFNQHDPGLRTPGLKAPSYVDRYVPIDVTGKAVLRITRADSPTGDEKRGADTTGSPLGGNQPESSISESQLNIHEARRPAFDWLSQKQNSVILGDPGYGKSALLRYVALSLLDPESTDIHWLDPAHLRRLPVWMSFARYAAVIKEQPNASVNDYIRDWLHQHSFDDIHLLFERALKRSDVLLLVDGLDEGISAQHRHEALNRIITFVQSSGAAVICTSRPRGFSRIGTPDAWTTAAIAPMRDSQVQKLAARWFSVTEIDDGASSAGGVAREQAQRRAESFLRAVNENSRTHDLARNPLLCQTMIELFRYSHRLPEARVGAYGQIIELLLSEHPAARAHAAYSETPAKTLGLRDADLRDILVRIAADLQNNETTGVSNADHCRSICAAFLEDDTYGLGLQKPKARRLAKDIIEQLVAHYGLLVERSPGEINFVHLSIQEYLTAEYVSRDAEDEQLDWLASVWLSPKWRECVTSWFGIHGARGNKGLTGRAAGRLSQLGDAGEWQRLESLELRAELACTDLGLPISESRKAVQQATLAVETSPFPAHRTSLARIITLGAIGSAVRDECTASVRRWAPGRSSFGRASLLKTFETWEPEDDLREILLRALHDEDLQCRRAAVDSLVAVFGSRPEILHTLLQLANHDARPTVRATALRGLSARAEWAETASAASAANLESSSAELLLAACEARVRLGCHDDDDLRRMWRVWSTDTIDFWVRDDLAEVLCIGWPRHIGIRREFVELLQRDASPLERQIPLEYLVRCYSNDDDIASLVAGLFDRHGGHIAMHMDPVWQLLIAHFRGHPVVAAVVRRMLNAHKEKCAAIFWVPETAPAFIVIGDDAARDELLLAYPSEKDMGRYWIAKTLVDGWPDDASVQSSLQHWASQDADTAAPLAEWAKMLHSKREDRHKWLMRLVRDASGRIVSGAIRMLLEEFPDDESRKLVEVRLNDDDIWYYHRIHIEGWLARDFPTRKSSLDTVNRALSEIDGPQLSDLAASYEHHASLRPKILGAAVVAPEEVRMTVATTLRDRTVEAQTIENLTPHVMAENSGPVRVTALIARARAIRDNEAAVQTFSDSLANELSSLGTNYQSRRRTALAAMIELGQAKRAVAVMAEQERPRWSDVLLRSLNKDTVSLGVVVDNWHTLKPLLEVSGLDSELPIQGLVECGYGAVLDQAAMPRDALDAYLKSASPERHSLYYFDEISRRFPRSTFLRDKLLTTFDGSPYDNRPKFKAARLLLEHFKSNTEVLAALKARLRSSDARFQATSPGVIAILALGWPGSFLEDRLQSALESDREKWPARDRLLAAVSLHDATAAEQAAKSLLAEPLHVWRYRHEDVHALRYWSRDALSTSALKRWCESNNGTMSITGLSLVSSEQPNELLAAALLIERFNEQMMNSASAPTDGLDAIAGTVTSWVVRASSAILDSVQR